MQLSLSCLLVAAVTAPHPEPRTRVIVLGVDHSIQLVSARSQPAAYRAFVDRLAPDAIAIERDPESFSRGDHYEFTYEIQYLIVPYARSHGTPLFPVDWIPPVEDQLLAFGVDLDRPPAIRPATGFQAFLTFPDSAAIRTPLFFADGDANRAQGRAWYQSPDAPPARDFPRRLYLYRTWLQARRIATAAAELRGKTLLVVIGALHKDQIERILAADSAIELVQPSTIGEPPGDPTAAATPAELAAIASFNLLGLQPGAGAVDWAWLERVVARLDTTAPGPEAELFRVRLLRLTARVRAADAIVRYRDLVETTPATLRFTWTGVKFAERVDSYFDPFGNLGVRNRARIELARELVAMGQGEEAARIRRDVDAELRPGQRAELDAYWGPFLESAPAAR